MLLLRVVWTHHQRLPLCWLLGMPLKYIELVIVLIEPVRDDLFFVWHSALRQGHSFSHYSWVICCCKGMHNPPKLSCVFKQRSSAIKRPNVYQEYIPHTITPPPPSVRTVDTRQVGSMVSYSQMPNSHPTICMSQQKPIRGRFMRPDSISPVFICPLWASLYPL